MRNISLALTASLLIGGCMFHRVEETATERFRFEVRDKPKIEVRLDEGSIEVVGTSSDEVTVNIIKKARGPNQRVAEALLEELQVDVRQQDTTVSVTVDARRSAGWRSDDGHISVSTGSLRSDVEIRVPKEADLLLTTEDGRIEVERVEGRIEAETLDGRLRLREIKGTVTAHTNDGSIIGLDLEGDVDLSSEDGRIELEGSFGDLRAITSDGSIKIRSDSDAPSPTDDWLIRTSDGSVTLSVPVELSAELEASTSDGRIVNELDLSDARETQTRLTGTLGKGGNLILVKTLDGRITLRAR